jgi:hypothetical protein
LFEETAMIQAAMAIVSTMCDDAMMLEVTLLEPMLR